MVGDAEATRRRLLDAAAEEFAGYGIAGARVDRIATTARANKAQIYHYFGGKDALFDAVIHELVVNTVRDVPIDPLNLPGYAARLFDGYEERPRIARIATWYRLEREGTDTLVSIIVESNRTKVAAIAEAQRAGRVSDRWPAADLLALVLAVAGMWTSMTPEFTALFDGRTRAGRRRLVVEAVHALLGTEPPPADGTGDPADRGA
jgi:AcrR family transcriptional regulator